MSDSGFPDDPGSEQAASDPPAPVTPVAPAPAPMPPPSAAAAPSLPSPPSPPFPLAPLRPVVGYAGFWIRFLAWFFDAVILFVVGLATNAVIRFAAGVPLTPLWGSSRGASAASNCVESLVGIVVWWLYVATSESSPAQATLGKRALRLRVTDLAGRRISFGRATGRNFAKVLSGLTLFVGFMMAAFTNRRQALHDLVAETVVLHDIP